MANKPFNFKPKVRQGMFKDESCGWDDVPILSIHQVKVLIGEFYEELFAKFFNYKRIKSTSFDMCPDMENDNGGIGEIKASNYKSQFKINPKQVEFYSALLEKKETKNVKWVFVVHTFTKIMRQVKWKSEVYENLAKHTIAAVVMDQSCVIELLHKIPIHHYELPWGDLQLIPARIISALCQNEEKVAMAKEWLRAEGYYDEEIQWPGPIKVFGNKIPRFTVKEAIIDCNRNLQ